MAFMHSRPFRCRWRASTFYAKKPIAATLAEAQAMVATARQCGVVLLEAIPTIFYPGFDILLPLLPRVGCVRRITAVYCQYSSRYDAVKAGEKRNAFDQTWAMPRFWIGHLLCGAYNGAFGLARRHRGHKCVYQRV